MSDQYRGGETPPLKFQEQTVIKVITGKRESFVSLYMLLLLFFSLCAAFLVVALLAAFLAATVGRAETGDIGRFLKIIASFDFKNSALQNVTGAETDALIAACALAAGIVFSILSLIFGAALGILKSRRIFSRAVPALLPGRKRGFLPTHEGIYKLCYQNLWTNNKFYSLYPWDSLFLYAVDEAKKRVILKAGKAQMPLLPWDREGGQFLELKALVLGHLSPERQILPEKKMRYRWGRVAAALLILFALQILLSGGLLRASRPGAGSEYCDAGGSVHFTQEKAFGPAIHVMWIFGREGKSVHTYCPLHGTYYMTLHPLVYMRSAGRLVHENEASQVMNGLLLLSFLLIPPLIWLYSLAAAFYIGKPPRFRFNVL